MKKNTVTNKQVQENMQDVLVRTEIEFDKPVTYVTVRMKNGFTLRESTTCVDPANYSEEIGKQICLEKIEDKVWFLLGYALQDKLYNADNKAPEKKEEKVQTGYFASKKGDGLGIWFQKDDTDYRVEVDRYGHVTEPSTKAHQTYAVYTDKELTRKPLSRRFCDLRVGHTYEFTVDGHRQLAKLQDIDLFFFSFITVDTETGFTGLGSIPKDEMIDMIEDNDIVRVTIKK